MIYCNLIWGKTYSTTLQPLFRAQKRCIRTLNYRRKFEHTNPDFIHMKILKLDDTVTYSAMVYTYKVLNNITQSSLNLTLNLNDRFRHNNVLDLIIPFVRSTQSQQYPHYYCPQIWNELPVEIRTRPPVMTFKNSLKHYLIGKYLEN